MFKCKDRITVKISENQSGQRLDKAISELLPYCSRSQIKEWIHDLNVLVDGNIWNRPKKKVLGKETVIINADFQENIYSKPQDIPLNIIYEDDDIIVINKSQNLVVHPGAGNSDNTILNALLYHYPLISKIPRAGIVHRLDKNSTGLMVIAKTALAQIRLSRSLYLHKIVREYEAIAVGYIVSGDKIEQPIRRHQTNRIRMTIHPAGKPAITHYRVIEHFREHTRLRLRLETGRTHQIRVHMAHISHPLVGDRLYGGRPRFPIGASEELISILRKFNRQALHSVMLRLHHPMSGIQMEWYAPVPKDMAELIRAMRIDFREHFRECKKAHNAVGVSKTRK